MIKGVNHMYVGNMLKKGESKRKFTGVTVQSLPVTTKGLEVDLESGGPDLEVKQATKSSHAAHARDNARDNARENAREQSRKVTHARDQHPPQSPGSDVSTVTNEWRDRVPDRQKLHAVADEKLAKVTRSEKRFQTVRMMMLVLVPMIALIGYSSYFVVETYKKNIQNNQMRMIIKFSIDLGEVLTSLQLERDQSVLYLSNIGPATKTFLLKQYLDTDEYIDRLSMWPGELEANVHTYVRTRKAFQLHLTAHRNSLDIHNYSVYEEIRFYNELLKIFENWLYNTLGESRTSTMWKSLVSYQKIIAAQLHGGVERALGVLFFSKGITVQHSTYVWYNMELHYFRQSLKMARNFSSIVRPIASYSPGGVSAVNLSHSIAASRKSIEYLNISNPSIAAARDWFDTMTTYMDILKGIQSDLADDILKAVNGQGRSTHFLLGSSILTVVLVAAMIPFLLRIIMRTMRDWQQFSRMLADKTKELDQEKEKNDSLLEQMLPRQVATRLKKGIAVRARYYKEVTVFFSDIVGFTGMTKKCSPLELVSLLNDIYGLFDSRIDLYDVYKVETVGRSYLVASGLPRPNGQRHALEVADLAIDLIQTIRNTNLPSLDNVPMRMRVGIHSGPVMAGIVGSRLPRYSIFGETVQTAAVVQSSCFPDYIQISSTTQAILDPTGRYRLVARTKSDKEGKMRIGKTYWLIGHSVAPIPSSMKARHVAPPNSYIQNPALQNQASPGVASGVLAPPGSGGFGGIPESLEPVCGLAEVHRTRSSISMPCLQQEVHQEEELCLPYLRAPMTSSAGLIRLRAPGSPEGSDQSESFSMSTLYSPESYRAPHQAHRTSEPLSQPLSQPQSQLESEPHSEPQTRPLSEPDQWVNVPVITETSPSEKLDKTPEIKSENNLEDDLGDDLADDHGNDLADDLDHSLDSDVEEPELLITMDSTPEPEVIPPAPDDLPPYPEPSASDNYVSPEEELLLEQQDLPPPPIQWFGEEAAVPEPEMTSSNEIIETQPEVSLGETAEKSISDDAPAAIDIIKESKNIIRDSITEESPLTQDQLRRKRRSTTVTGTFYEKSGDSSRRAGSAGKAGIKEGKNQ